MENFIAKSLLHKFSARIGEKLLHKCASFYCVFYRFLIFIYFCPISAFHTPFLGNFINLCIWWLKAENYPSQPLLPLGHWRLLFVTACQKNNSWRLHVAFALLIKTGGGNPSKYCFAELDHQLLVKDVYGGKRCPWETSAFNLRTIKS